MNDFTILHLSDLHINTKGKKLPLLLENLLIDIKKEMEHSKYIIVVITGDILHKANYENKDCALAFFQKLKMLLEKKIKEIYIVPGNHDKERNVLDEKIIDGYKDKDKIKKNTDVFYPNKWKYIRMAFDEHIQLVEDIYSIFYTKEQVKKKVLRETFGVRIDKVNGKTICFLLLNTAWSSIGDNDERHLKIGDFQIEKLKKAYDAECAKQKDKIALTIAVAHHPVNWLRGKDENDLQNMLLADTGLKANIYVCGHTHTRDVINWQNNRHSLTTLVSGLGWPDGTTEHPHAHTYSSYVFNLDINSIDVYMRSSDDASIFEPDFRIYTQERNKKENKIIMPINICKTQAYYKLGAVETRSQKGCYITEDFLEEMRDYAELVANIQSAVQDRLINLKLDTYENLCLALNETNKLPDIDKRDLDNLSDFWFKEEPLRSSVMETLLKNEWVVSDFEKQFSAYLEDICIDFYKKLVEMKKQAKVRVHFRICEKKVEYREQLKYVKESFYGYGIEEHVMREMPYSELLEEAYKVHRPLIASANAEYCSQSMEINEKKDFYKWCDFITIIPQFVQNRCIKYIQKNGKILFEYPILTFGVTVYNRDERKILFLLDYLRFDILIGKMIQAFLYYMPINLEHFVETRESERSI